MRKHYLLITFLLLSAFATIISCGSSDDSSDYKDLSPVVVDLTTVPYPKLSDYKFFEGELKNLEPAYKVLPYDLNSSLFTDYALKKRFVWMPEGSHAIYTSDSEILNFPTGAALIKNFYYENVLPANTTRIIETRVMIKKADGWIFASYVWNNDQTEAFLDMDGSTTTVTWMQNEREKSVNYVIPNGNDCTTCHSSNSIYTPIGIKPQNLFKNFSYTTGEQNQLEKWKSEGYINDYAQNTTATVNWEDESKSLDLRARSYLDINCAHCHTPGGNCDDMPLNLAFVATTNPINLGICVEPHDFVSGNQTYIIAAQDSWMSLLPFKMQSTQQSEMMPPIGRTTSHREGTALINEWIDAMENPCP
ncbi:hypothetical protein [Flavobacterium sp. NRK1]|uniref:hypothetical protein n=1 Tax=Flavobacterium sp. NRK1 TaxID=2954929 RepID=UPI002093BDEB|nr:hypothetical protein [Flavobacterium sp. NRK1]MCO6148531.1 hypothetical protein [Flavobacterium sp. NRK1]